MGTSVALSKLRARLLKGNTVHVSGVYGSFVGAMLVAVSQELEQPIWVVCASDQEAAQIYRDILVWLPEKTCLYPSTHKEVDNAILHRVESLRILRSEKSFVWVTSYEAMSEGALDPENIELHVLTFCKGDNVNLKYYLDDLVSAGYRREDMVDMPGEFSVRGGIVDIFPLGAIDPLRIEFFGDTVEQIATFDMASQRLKETLKNVTILPCWEFKNIFEHSVYRVTDGIPDNCIGVMVEPLSVQKVATKEGCVSFVETWATFVFAKTLTVSLVTPEGHWADNEIVLPVHATEVLDHDAAAFRRNLDYWTDLDLDIYVFCRHFKEQKHFEDFMEQHKLQEYSAKLIACVGSLSSGFVAEDCGVAVMAAADLFPTREGVPKRKARAHASVPLSSLVDLKHGDFVVHLGYGIALYQGLHRLDHEGSLRDYVKLEFRNKDILYLPIEQVDLIQKYIGLEKANPRLHKLGSKAWSRDKKSTEEAIKDLAAQMLEVQAQRKSLEGFVYDKTSEMEKMFANSFPFEETEDQQKAIDDVVRDMESSRPMDRLICGDVGYGKTEVAMRAACKAVMNHKQVAILVPTTVLAFQHFRNFQERFKDFPVNVEMLSRFRSRAEQKAIIEDLKLGKIDIVIGTHRLLQNDIQYHNLGLLVTDEEQRFGVTHKEKIKRFCKMVDILTMSATPIPRTLYMSLTGMREMSTIYTAPRERLPVHTKVCGFDERLIVSAIQFELEREGQVFFLHNRIQNIHKIAEQIQKLLPEARVRFGHGQMSEKKLEETIMGFVNYEFDVFVSTTIVESGVDISNANTMIINNADHFGLADLYQLRGRVGRSNRKAYAYLLVNPRKQLSPDAQQRLQAIKEYSGVGAGYRIAMRDLELRGAGNLLGREQSGHISRIGFDMYCALLRKHMKQMKGEVPDIIPASLDLKLDITINPEFISLMGERLDVYRRIASALSEDELQEVKSYVKDRYGHHLPDNLLLLFEMSKIKIVAAVQGYTHIGRRRDLLDLVKPEKHKVEKLKNKDISPRELLDMVWSCL